MKNNSFIILPFLLSFILGALQSCEKTYIPKPIGYNRLDLPEDHKYKLLPDSLPFSFEYSEYAKLLDDTSWISERYWIEIYYPKLSANVHVTFKNLRKNEKTLKELFEDSYFLTSKHQIKAYSIDDIIMKSPDGKTFSIAELEGEVPSHFQFVCTDSVDNFIRGALYFNTKVHSDSLKPAIDYVKVDVVKMMNTLKWKDLTSYY